jgi:hypothetical protein
VVIISFCGLSNVTGCFFGGWDCGGQTETKSPPGPNLHTGSICLLGWLFILRTLPLAIAFIGKRGVKTLTKTEQKLMD